ncbi:hypothetical protein LOD99_5218 [Oopsacas minuta]|uniref:Uncharacterized protein n=1 Tax=Oopsacas minuta TaxID=111878 RepID=A0AAV7JR91_9METZ|nr:hypothetical protein LOD99_5218 [Oopsacas minuta]
MIFLLKQRSPLYLKKTMKNLKILHRNIFALLRVTIYSQNINVSNFKAVCEEIYLFLLDHYPWVSITPTVHKFLAHTLSIHRSEDNHGLKIFSEEGLEQAHKQIRRFSEYLSQKSDTLLEMKDIFSQIYVIV